MPTYLSRDWGHDWGSLRPAWTLAPTTRTWLWILGSVRIGPYVAAGMAAGSGHALVQRESQSGVGAAFDHEYGRLRSDGAAGHS